MALKGVTRKEIQEKFEVSHTTVQNWESRGWIRPYGFERGVAVYDPDEIEGFDPDNPPETLEGSQGMSTEAITIAELIKALKNQHAHLADVLKIVTGPGVEMLRTYGETVQHSVESAAAANDKLKELWESHLEMTREQMLMKIEQERDEKKEQRKDMLLSQTMKFALPLIAKRVESGLARKGSIPGGHSIVDAIQDADAKLQRRAELLNILLPTISDEQKESLEGAGVMSKELVMFIGECRGDPSHIARRPDMVQEISAALCTLTPSQLNVLLELEVISPEQANLIQEIVGNDQQKDPEPEPRPQQEPAVERKAPARRKGSKPSGNPDDA